MSGVPKESGDIEETAMASPAAGAAGPTAQGSERVVLHPRAAERAARGKAARGQCPREGHADWRPAADRPDPVALLDAQAANRVPELVPIRYGRMLASPFAFYRGAAAIMAADLSAATRTGLTVQLCGDAHVSNFGAFASPERALVLDINDFDETLPGPWEWDVKRLAGSLEIVGRERGWDAAACRDLVLASVGEYHRAMHEFAQMGNLEVWYLHLDPAVVRARWGIEAEPGAMKAFDAEFAHAPLRDNMRALEKLTCRVDGELRIAAHPPLVVPIENLVGGQEQDSIAAMIRRTIQGYRLSLEGDRRRLLESFQYTHMARKVVGVGSVGTRTWIALLLGRDDGDPLFLQIKEAQTSVLEPYLGKSAYGHHGQRVVEGQWLMQSASDIFLGWEQVPIGIDGQPHDYYVRQLWDWKVSADVERMARGELKLYGQMCGWTLARAHARSGDRIAIAAYLGESAHFDAALAGFAAAYADQNARDFDALAAAAKAGRVRVEMGI